MTRYEWLARAVANHRSSECLLWPFSVDTHGYPHLSVVNDGKRATMRAHRVAFKLVHGHWPEPCGLHSCDTPRCINPQHIFEGTNGDNVADKVKKDRQQKGVDVPSAQLTDQLVIKLRLEYADKRLTFEALSKKYGVARNAIRGAIIGEAWKHIPGSVQARPTKAKQDFCKYGHPLTAGNLYIYGRSRQCKTCAIENAKKRRAS